MNSICPFCDKVQPTPSIQDSQGVETCESCGGRWAATMASQPNATMPSQPNVTVPSQPNVAKPNSDARPEEATPNIPSGKLGYSSASGTYYPGADRTLLGQGFGIASFIAGLVAILGTFSCMCFGFLTTPISVIGIVLGFTSLFLKWRDQATQGWIYPVVGLICSLSTLLFWSIYMAYNLGGAYPAELHSF